MELEIHVSVFLRADWRLGFLFDWRFSVEKKKQFPIISPTNYDGIAKIYFVYFFTSLIFFSFSVFFCTEGYHRSELRFSDISNLIGEDWLPLSEKLGINSAEAAVIRSEYPESVPKQALTMLRIWHQEAGSKASGEKTC